MSNADKNGVLYLGNKVDGEWSPYFYFLSEIKLVCTKFQPSNEGEAEDGDEDDDSNSLYYNHPVRGVILLIFMNC